MLDDFREWLSDYLRYFMLGGAILLVVLVVVLTFRACSGGKKDDNTPQDTQKIEQEVTPTAAPQKDEKDEVTNPLTENDGEVAQLIKDYYKAFGEKDIEGLQKIVTDLSPTDEAKIENAKDYIEGYEVTKVYTKAGLEENSYVAYACYELKCSGIETAVPMLSQLYVVTDNDGKLLINASEENNEEVKAYMVEQQKDNDVVELKHSVKEAYDKAQKDDTALADFLAGLGEETSEKVGSIMTVTKGCNVRAEASSDADIIGGYDEGDEVEVLGTSGEWYEIEYEGSTGYIHNSLLE